MRTGRPKATLISSDERTDLLALTRSRSLPTALTLRGAILQKLARLCQRISGTEH
jgi:putative transposase